MLSRVSWIAGAASAGVLLAAANRFGLDYAPIESQTAYPAEWLPLVGFGVFATACYVVAWGSRSRWTAACVTGLYVGCWIGIWILAGGSSVPGRDTSGNMAVTQLIMSEGALPDPNLGTLVYSSFPGEHLLLGVLSQLSGLGVYETLPYLLLGQTLAYALLGFALIAYLLPAPRWAAISAMLAVQANPYNGAMTVMYPGNFALVYMLLGLTILARLAEGRGGAAERIAFIVTGLALTVSHLVTTAALGAVAAVMWLLRRHRRPITLSMIALVAALLVAWQLYWAATVFRQWMISLANTIEDPTSIIAFLSIRLNANLGGAIPAWATVVQYISIALAYGLGTLIAIYVLVRRRWADPADWVMASGLVAVVLLTMIGTAGQFGTQFYRYFVFAPVFTVPFLVRVIVSQRPHIRARLGVALAAVALVLAAPSWLAYNKVARSARDYPAERAVGAFLAATYGDGRDLFVHTPTSFGASVAFFMPYVRPEQAIREIPASQDEIWGYMLALAPGLQIAAEDGRNRVAVYSQKRSQIVLGHLFGVPPDDARYQEVTRRLEALTEIFDDGIVGAYLPAAVAPRP